MKNKYGFTLVEVMIIVAIIGLLVAIGIPAFLGAVERAEELSLAIEVEEPVTPNQKIVCDPLPDVIPNVAAKYVTHTNYMYPSSMDDCIITYTNTITPSETTVEKYKTIDFTFHCQ